MAKAPKINALSPWEDRWSAPTEDTLFSIYKDQAGKVVKNAFENFSSFDDVSRDLYWYGVSWKWTVRFQLDDLDQDELDALAYMVPKPEMLTVVVPINDAILESMPFRRLNRYIRDAIRSAQTRQTDEVIWVIFTPTASTEIEHITDLLKRKIKFLRSAS